MNMMKNLLNEKNIQSLKKRRVFFIHAWSSFVMLKCSLHEDEEKTFDMQTLNTVSNYTQTHSLSLARRYNYDGEKVTFQSKMLIMFE